MDIGHDYRTFAETCQVLTSRYLPNQPGAEFPGDSEQTHLFPRIIPRPCPVSGGFPLFQAIRYRMCMANHGSRLRIYVSAGFDECRRSGA